MKHREAIQNEKGLTLIELLLSVAIFGLVMVSLFSFMTIISRQYSKANTEVNVQNEVQTLTNHLQNIITSADTNIGLSGDKLFMIDVSEFEVIEYDSANECIYYYSSDQLSASADEMQEYEDLDDRDDKLNKAISIVAAHPITSIADNRATYLMTEYVTEFSISPNPTDNYVAINVTLNRDNVTYSAAKNIYLRNDLYEVEGSGIHGSPGTTTTPGAGTPTSTPAPTPGGGTPDTPTPTPAPTPVPGEGFGGSLPETEPEKYKYVLDVSGSAITKYLYVNCYNATATVKNAVTGEVLAVVSNANQHIDISAYAGTDTRFIIEFSDYTYDPQPKVYLWNSEWQNDESVKPGMLHVTTDMKNTVDQVTVN